eukprot:Gb_39856 [translate_table: standard]
MPSISLIGSSRARSARDGRLGKAALVLSSIEDSISIM